MVMMTTTMMKLMMTRGRRVVVVVHGKVQCWLFAVCFLPRPNWP